MDVGELETCEKLGVYVAQCVFGVPPSKLPKRVFQLAAYPSLDE